MTKRFSRAELYEMVWSRPLRDLAKDFGLSDSGLAKSCRKANIPRPPRGYWAKKAAGKPVTQTSLPKRGPGMSDTVMIGGGPYRYYQVLSDQELLALEPKPPSFEEPISSFEKCAQKIIGVAPIPPFPERAHRQIQKLLDADEERRHKYHASAYPSSWDAPLFEDPIEQRRLKLINAIMASLEAAGFRVSIEGKDGRRLSANIHDTSVSFTLDTTTQKLDPRRRNAIETRGSSENLVCIIESWDPEPGFKTSWNDSSARTLETQLLSIVRTIVVMAEVQYRRGQWNRYDFLLQLKTKLIERMEKEKAEAARKEAARLEAIERARIDRLTSDAQAYRQAQDIRAFVSNVLSQHENGQLPATDNDIQAWRAWALAQAERVDPIRSGRFIASIEDDVGNDQPTE